MGLNILNTDTYLFTLSFVDKPQCKIARDKIVTKARASALKEFPVDVGKWSDGERVSSTSGTTISRIPH